jgi:hypothetical protein
MPHWSKLKALNAALSGVLRAKNYTHEVLQGLGYSRNDIDKIRVSGAI